MLRSRYCQSLSAIIITYIFCSIGVITAQFTDQYFTQFGLEEGLPSNNIYSVNQDSRGIIWIGTQTGIVKYDGYSFYTFNSKDGLYQNEVIDIKIDSKDRIWLNTTGPPCYIKQDTVHYLTELESPNISPNYDMKEDHNGDVWLSTEKNIYKLNGDDLSIITNYYVSELSGHIIGGSQNEFYVFNGDHVLKYEGTQAPEILDIISLTDRDLFDNSVSYFKWPHLFYKDEKSLRSINIQTGDISTIIKNGFEAYSFTIQGDYLLGLSRSGGLLLYNLTKEEELQSPLRLLEEETLGAVKLDKEGNLWVPTYRSGLLLLKPLSKKIIPSNENIDGTSIHLESLVFDSRGDLWMGTDNGVIIRERNGYQKKYLVPSRSESTNRILDIDVIGDDEYLITGDAGLYLFDGSDFKHLSDIPAKKSSYSSGRILISTYKNVIQSTKQYFKNLRTMMNASDLFNDPSINIVKDKRSYANAYGDKSEIWIATESDGLLKILDEQITNYGDIFNELKSSIQDIITMPNGLTIIASSGEGLFIIKEEKFISIDSEDGLASNVVHCLSSNKNKIYAGTNKGLSIIEFDENWENYSIEIINKSIGLATNEIHDLECKNDTIYLATHKGLVKINDNLKLDKNNKRVPLVKIDDILVNNISKSLTKKQTLSHFENNLIIKFSGVDVINANQLAYAYKLSGFDEEWITTKSREIRYGNLPSGQYIFKVASVIENKIQESQSDSVEIVIQQKFSESIWFKIAIATSILGLLFFAFYLYNTNNQKNVLSRLVSQRTKELDEKMKALKIANQKLEESNDSIRNYAYISSHDLKSPLRNVGSFVQLLAKKNEDNFDNKDKEYVKFVTDGVNNMTNTIDDLLAYNTLDKDEPTTEVNIGEVVNLVLADLSLLIKEKSANIILCDNFPIVQAHLTKVKALFQNLIENGIKYNESDIPEIEISFEKKSLEYLFKVKDNGIGIDSKYGEKIFMMFQRLHDRSSYSGTGIGLAMCQKIVNSYGGKIWVESNKTVGSCFNLTLPAK